ncbi:hypothetical protein J6590_055942 [Homalodisca vitripennis]|nr:hypothetical protein J6590_055942 [Homalodisca vitripennis]
MVKSRYEPSPATRADFCYVCEEYYDSVSNVASRFHDSCGGTADGSDKQPVRRRLPANCTLLWAALDKTEPRHAKKILASVLGRGGVKKPPPSRD